ncbi:hypothetical protein FHL15_000254 [Xylaria flabelliformis]|uniref:Uncharacterized protein n=1 Tax=Xylaria flabelliformis TaxID=2512241 RepID=A0A553IFD1_9PEZI|nr:hypothetical protein FHL15_000254 [Xylaria flabelliformis]
MKTSIIKSTAVIAIALCSQAVIVAAVAPNVTAVPIGTSCTSYPGFDGSNAGPFIGVADSTGQVVDGIGLNAAYYVDGTHQYGYLSTTTGGEATWQDLVISGDPTLEGALGFGFPEDRYANIPVQPYWHFLDGQQVPGVFIGAEDSTTFGYQDNWAGVAGEYYLLRLLGTEKFTKWELDKRDTVGFLKLTYDY